jgi:Prp8 binding protein
MEEKGPSPPVPPPNKRFRKDGGGAIQLYHEPVRTSSLPAPTLQLTGHQGSVYALSYSPSGNALCSASFDKTCLLWSHGNNITSAYEDNDDENNGFNRPVTTNGSYENYNVLTGHKNAVLDCVWYNEETVVTASADKTVALYDALTGKRLRKWDRHEGIVNAVAVVSCDHAQSAVVVSASDDGSCLVWDTRQKRSTGSLLLPDADFPVTAVAGCGECIYSAGLDNMIYCWDVRKLARVYALKGHTDTVTCLSMHPAGTHVLSNSMDNTLRSWDVRPFVTGKKGNRHCKTFLGHKHNAEKGLLKCSWSSDGSMVTAGSADKLVHIWDEFSTEELYLLPGHKGCVNTCIFHPVDSVIASGSSDKHIFVGELS